MSELKKIPYYYLHSISAVYRKAHGKWSWFNSENNTWFNLARQKTKRQKESWDNFFFNASLKGQAEQLTKEEVFLKLL